ncbi:hypothetical protein H4Q26_008171 [Puccinia striiformis f. sp. tritici PST-130]|nr:hypothetical protein H4Q26_008171 [Puccinia striiformis f. sp. tritici PST-130]
MLTGEEVAKAANNSLLCSKQGMTRGGCHANLNVDFHIPLQIVIIFLWPHLSSGYRSSQPTLPNLSTTNITQAARFLHSCVLLDSINALEVSSLELRRIGKLQEFYRNLCAESVLNEGPEIRDLWDKLLSTLHIATSQAQLLHSNGIWETNLLLNEYKSFMRPNMFSGVTVNAIITSFATVLQHFLLVSNNLTDTIQAAILSHQTLQAQILKAHKRLSIETKQQGFLQCCLNLLLGNAWLMRRESELSTMSKASSIVESIAPSIHDIKIRNERYNNNVVTLSVRLQFKSPFCCG